MGERDGEAAQELLGRKCLGECVSRDISSNIE